MRNKREGFKKWTPKQLSDLSANYESMLMDDLIKLIGKPRPAIYGMAYRLQLSNNRTTVDHRANWEQRKKERPEIKVSKNNAPTHGIYVGRDRPFKTKPVDLSAQKPIRIDHRTTVYVSKSATREQINKILSKYNPLSK